MDRRESVEDEPRSGRPYTSKTDENVTKVRALVRSDRRLTVRMIGSELNMNHQTVHDNFTEELGMQYRDYCFFNIHDKCFLVFINEQSILQYREF